MLRMSSPKNTHEVSAEICRRSQTVYFVRTLPQSYPLVGYFPRQVVGATYNLRTRNSGEVFLTFSASAVRLAGGKQRANGVWP